MPESKKTSAKHVLSVDDEHEFSHWHLPDMTEDQSLGPSNMFGKKPQGHVVEDVEIKPAPLTMAQLEEMRAIAEQEGFEQGKDEGYQAGLEQGRLEGLEQGHQEGLIQGEQQGLETGKTNAQTLVTRFSHILEQFEQPLTVLDMEIESQLLSLVITLAKSVINHEFKTHPEHILAVLRQGVDALPIKEQRVKIRVNAEDAELIGQFYSEEQLEKHSWQLDIDPSLQVGDCIIDSARSSVNLCLEERIIQALSQIQEQVQNLDAEVLANKGEDKHYTSRTVDDIHKDAAPAVNTTAPDDTSADIGSAAEHPSPMAQAEEGLEVGTLAADTLKEEEPSEIQPEKAKAVDSQTDVQTHAEPIPAKDRLAGSPAPETSNLTDTERDS